MARLPLLTVLVVVALQAQTPMLPDLLDALSRAASTFAWSAPWLSARESLTQRGRQASIQLLKGTARQMKAIQVTIPPEFTTHRIVSDWGFGPPGSPRAFHEHRSVLTIDDRRPQDASSVRHALTLDIGSPDDARKKKNLEDLEQSALDGAASDFSPLLLLFAKVRQAGYHFRFDGARQNGGEQAFAVHYREAGGPGSLIEFRDRGEKRHVTEGEIWLRESDLLPVRITMNAEERLSSRYVLRNEAEIQYLPTPFGLAPATIVHRQFLNDDLLVENSFSYSEYKGRIPFP